MSTETGTIRKATLVAEAARAMRADPQTPATDRHTLLNLLAMKNEQLALFYDAIQYAREQSRAR